MWCFNHAYSVKSRDKKDLLVISLLVAVEYYLMVDLSDQELVMARQKLLEKGTMV